MGDNFLIDKSEKKYILICLLINWLSKINAVALKSHYVLDDKTFLYKLHLV